MNAIYFLRWVWAIGIEIVAFKLFVFPSRQKNFLKIRIIPKDKSGLCTPVGGIFGSELNSLGQLLGVLDWFVEHLELQIT